LEISAARRIILLTVVALAAVPAGLPALSHAAVREPYRSGDFGGFRNILPPGQNGFENSSDLFLFESSHTYPPHWIDQYGMYRDLVYSSPGLKAADVANFYKDASFGVKAGDEERVYSPPLHSGVTIVRDKDFGVPHIYGQTRADVEYGIGYASAEDRLFFMDVLRHAGRAELSGFAGGAKANKDLDREQWQLAPYTEDDLQRQFALADDVYGAEGAQLQQDVQNYVAGINGYITEARLNPNKMPVEYAAIQKPLEDWKLTDPIATASLIGGIFGKGGGREVESALVLEAARARFGQSAGMSVWRDFRRAEDPEAPTTVRGTSFPYEVPTGINPAAVALPDNGSVCDPDPSTGLCPPTAGPSSSQTSSSSASVPLSLLAFPTAASNALLISGANSASGHPVAVMGPQVSYFIPEILMEIDAHCLGTCNGDPDFDAAGATFPGVSLYVLLGRGKDYSWSATSAGQDIIDTFAEELCEPGGGAPTINSTHYLYKGQCRPMEALTRTNLITPNPADPSPAETYVLTSLRTVHGIVYKRGKVGGKFVAFTRQRSSYFHEADSSLAFAQLNNPDRLQNAQDFQQAMYKVNLTFNWFYADDRDIAYFNSGNNPVRANGVDPNFPAKGDGTYDWQSFNPDLQTATYTPFSEHPQTINQSYITSWNNKQAPAYRAADDNYSYGPVYRSLSLDHRIDSVLSSGGKFTLPKLIDAMEDAGTVDLRGSEVLPWMLRAVGNPDPTKDPDLADAVNKLRAWMNAGAHRRDCTPVPGGCTPDGHYQYTRAIEIMDAWWPRAVEAEFKPALGSDLYNAIVDMTAMDSEHTMGLDNEPNNHGAHLGSAYQYGWYGYMQKDLRQVLHKSVQGAFSRTYCGGGKLSRCRTDLRNSLRAALGVPSSQLYDEDPNMPGTQRVERCPSSSSDQWCFDSVAFRSLGGINVETIPWINRPTFQQAVEVRGHRPR
jgi:acyl-homoserine lactone acylase PvdQ